MALWACTEVRSGSDGGVADAVSVDAALADAAPPRDSGLVGGEEAIRLYTLLCEAQTERDIELAVQCSGGDPDVWRAQREHEPEQCVAAALPGLQRGNFLIDTSSVARCLDALPAAGCDLISAAAPPSGSVRSTRACYQALALGRPEPLGAPCDILGNEFSPCGLDAACPSTVTGRLCGACTPLSQEGEPCRISVRPAQPGSFAR